MATTEVRFNRKVNRADCWMWTGLTTRGYPNQIWHEGRPWRVGHWALMHYRGIIVPSHRETDHLCHTEALARGECDGGPTCPHRACVNPWHLEVVDRSENTARRVRSTCRRGHPRNEENTYDWNGTLVCRPCRRLMRAQRLIHTDPAP